MNILLPSLLGVLLATDVANPAHTDPVPIAAIQGSGPRSPLEGRAATTTGVVTHRLKSGAFWIQSSTPDDDPASSEALLVRLRRDAEQPRPVQVGDALTVTGTVKEIAFRGALPTTAIEAHEISIGNTPVPLPPPIPWTALPTSSITAAIEHRESLEGMRIRLEEAWVVAAANRHDEVVLVSASNVQAGEPALRLLRGDGAGGVDYHPERIMIGADTPLAPRWSDARPGDRVEGLIGVLDYSFSNFKLLPSAGDWTIAGMPRWPVSQRSGPVGEWELTTFNIENLFDLVDAPDKNDEGTTPDRVGLERKLTKLRLALQYELASPAIVAVQEVENNTILCQLADRLARATGKPYRAISHESSDGRGIENGFLWDADRVTLLESRLLDSPAIRAAFASSQSMGREPLLGRFEVDGRELTVINLHLKSKWGDDALFGERQPPQRASEEKRAPQARAVREQIDRMLAEQPDRWLAVLGDCNDFQFPEPGEDDRHSLGILRGPAGPTQLFDALTLEDEAERYTYLYQGNAQVLDHVLLSPALRAEVVAADVLHFNAAFPVRWGELDDNPFRCSDHDAVEVRFQAR